MNASQPATSAVVKAAGALCWRRTGTALEVLLVHRPRYGDWSWPKGKLDDGEVPAVAAVREVAEETGLSVRLGISLPTARYRLSDSADKQVSYWAAQVSTDPMPSPPRPAEVDRCEWVSPEVAADRLTRRGDRLQLQSLVDAETEGALDTWPLLVLRHGSAVPRREWDGDDAHRPLATSGAHEADALTRLLAAWGPARVLTSPWARCRATVEPYASAHGAALVAEDRLTEAAHRHDPRAVAGLVGELLTTGEPTVLCTHRPVLGTLLGALAGHAGAGMPDPIPRRDPFLAAAEVLVAHVGRRSGRVVAVETHRPG